MAEGARFVWKIQKIREFGPAADYSNLSQPLPPPPEGMRWKKDDQTRQWELIFDPEEDKASSEAKRVITDDETKLPETQDIPKPSQTKESFYVEHLVLPTDTFQGLCLAYRISPVRLRQLNSFSGSSLKLAPSKLIIPITDLRSVLDGTIRIQDIDSPDFKRQVLSLEFPTLTPEEVHAYLIMCAWDLCAAIQTVKDDLDWEKSSSIPVNRKHSLNASSLTLVAHVAVPVTKTISNYANHPIEIELSSSIHGKSQSPSFFLSREIESYDRVLSRPLLPRQ